MASAILLLVSLVVVEVILHVSEVKAVRQRSTVGMATVYWLSTAVAGVPLFLWMNDLWLDTNWVNFALCMAAFPWFLWRHQAWQRHKIKGAE